MENLRPNGQRAKNAITLIWIVLALDIISLISNYFQYNLLQTFVNGEEILPETATANDTRQQLIAITYIIAHIISGVTFIQWFRRAYFNLHLKVNHLSHTEGWAAGSWFAPIVNLYRPYQIMKELYQETQKLLVKNNLGVNENFTTNFLSLWWALWVISGLIGQVVFRMKTESIDELISMTIAMMFLEIIGIPLALITIKVIKDYSNVEPLLNEIRDDKTTTA